MKYLALVLLVSLFAFQSHSKTPKKACDYSFDVENSVVEGTGFKYTEKTGVTGKFTGFKLNKTESKKSPKDLLNDLVVTVELMKLDSGNTIRDKNMRETLFAGILGDSVATVTVKKVMDKKISAEIKINEKTQMVDFDYSTNGQVMTATGVFDAMKFALGDQIAALKKRCGSLHTGSDGKSVTWTDFALKVTAKLKETCK